MKFVVVTSCATGIAHTFMAAEALSRAGKAAGHEMIIETQGAGGYKPTSVDVIQSADAVIFANDIGIRDENRFDGCKIVRSIPKAAIKNPGDLISQAEELAKS
jgi:PTS system fructose-specific IIC component